MQAKTSFHCTLLTIDFTVSCNALLSLFFVNGTINSSDDDDDDDDDMNGYRNC